MGNLSSLNIVPYTARVTMKAKRPKRERKHNLQWYISVDISWTKINKTFKTPWNPQNFPPYFQSNTCSFLLVVESGCS